MLTGSQLNNIKWKRLWQGRRIAEREQFEPSEWLKTRGKSWDQIPVVRRPNWPQRLELTRLRCAAALRRTSRPSPARCRSAMSSHPRMHERMRVERCRHLLNLMEEGMLPNWCSLTRRNLMLSSASTIKTTVFGVRMHPCKAEEWVDARIQPLLWFGRPSQPLEGLS